MSINVNIHHQNYILEGEHLEFVSLSDSLLVDERVIVLLRNFDSPESILFLSYFLPFFVSILLPSCLPVFLSSCHPVFPSSVLTTSQPVLSCFVFPPLASYFFASLYFPFTSCFSYPSYYTLPPLFPSSLFPFFIIIPYFLSLILCDVSSMSHPAWTQTQKLTQKQARTASLAVTYIVSHVHVCPPI